VEKILVVAPHFVVAMFHGLAAPFNFAYFRPGMAPTEFSWSRLAGFHHAGQEYKDIAFHRGKIFAVDGMGRLLAHELVIGETVSIGPCKHVISLHLDEAVFINVNYHLVTSSDSQKLLMVRWHIPNLMTGITTDHHPITLHVFEADLDKGRWLELTDLGNQVLFVGVTGSRAIAAEGSSEHYHQRFQGGNRVFLLAGNNWPWAWVHRVAGIAPRKCSHCRKLTDGAPSYCVYDMISGKASLVSLRRGNNSMKHYARSEWFFPSV
jgi:hypothetical protein